MSRSDYDHIELFSELHFFQIPLLGKVLRLRSGFRHAAQTPRKRLNFTARVPRSDHDNIELFRELH